MGAKNGATRYVAVVTQVKTRVIPPEPPTRSADRALLDYVLGRADASGRPLEPKPEEEA